MVSPASGPDDPAPPEGPRFLTAAELIAAAHARLSPPIWDYVCGAAESEVTKRRNREAIEEWAFRPRVLRRVGRVDCTTKLLGTVLRMPVLLAPIGSLQTVAEGGAATSVKAASRFGTLPITSSVSQPELEDCAAAAPGDKWFQLYIRGDWDWIAGMVGRIRAAGFSALVLTVDSAWYSLRERQMQHRWLPPSKTAGPSGEEYQALLDWETVARIRDIAGMPIVLKGIQTAEDAALARDAGIDVVYVSNHGGRQLDHARGCFTVLTEVATELGGKLPIVVDGGILRGSDVLKAVTLGATAVAIGRLQAYALAADGEGGVFRVLEILENEIRTAMAMLGLTGLGQLDRTLLDRLGAPVGGPDPFPLLSREIHF